MIDTEAPPFIEAFLEHYGIKGMKWGVRKSSDSSKTEKTSRFTPEQKARAKQAAVGAGVLVAAVGAAFLANKMRESGDLPVSTLRTAKPAAVKVIKDVQEQTDIMHTSRGKDRGFTFIKTGGVPNYLEDFSSVFGTNSEMNVGVRKLDDGRVAASFYDPEGRKDRATRTIPHQIIIPKAMSDGINNLDDVQEKIWPQLKDSYSEYYSKPPTNRV